MNIQIGWGEQIIRLEGGKVHIAGGVPFRAVDTVHDDIRATAMVVRAGEKYTVWLSCDFCHPTKQVEERIAELLCEKLPWFEPQQLILSGTHATACFFLSDTEILDSAHLLAKDPALLPIAEAREQFCRHAAEAVVQAAESLEDQDVEHAAIPILTGLCRRAVYQDGSAVMYGNVGQEDFVRMEYPDGGETHALYFYRHGTRELRAVMAAAPCPAQADEFSAHITADFWGYARSMVKAQFGADVKLLPLCRAAGELSPHDLFVLDRKTEWGNGEAERLGSRVGEHLISAAAHAKPLCGPENAAFAHVTAPVTFPARAITDEDCRWAQAYRADPANYGPDGRALDWKQDSLARHMVKFREQAITKYAARASVVRLGDLAIFTAPAELYCEYAARVRAGFRDFKTLDIQLTHDSIGYLPTKEAIAHGGYSTHHFSAFTDEVGGELYIKRIREMIAEAMR